MGASALAEGRHCTWRAVLVDARLVAAGLELTASLMARREHITLGPFTEPDRIAVFDVEPQRLSIQTTDGVLVERRDDPRSSFPPFDLGTTAWDPVQVAYFLSAAHWNYLTQPFSFTYPGVDVREIEPWDEGGQTWRRLAVRFPKLTPTTTPISFSITTPTSCCAAWTTHPRSPPTRPSRTTPTIPRRLTGSSSRRADVFTAATLMASPTKASRRSPWTSPRSPSRRQGPIGKATGADPIATDPDTRRHPDAAANDDESTPA